MPNPTGKNAYGTKEYPPDPELKETLLKYVRLSLTQKQKIERLVKDHNLSIGTTKLNEIERRLEIPSVRRTPAAAEIAAQAVSDEVEKDVSQSNGPNYVKARLKDQLIMVKRDDVRDLMHRFQPLGAEHRFPGNKKKVFRQPLSALGPFHEVSSDGHEKLGQQALKMGDIGLPIYSYKDKWTANVLKLTVVPDCRTNAAVGHLHLDFLEEIGGIPMQTTTDKGSEIGWLCAIQTALREAFAPDIDLEVYPATACIKSVHNTIIEAFWRWLRIKCGINVREHVLRGKTEHIFDANVAFHRDLFNWIFPPLVQAELDDFRTYWNQHKIRPQAEKSMPSGHVPADALEHPEFWGGINCLIKVPKETFKDLRAFLTEEVGSREEHLQWVTDDFAAMAENIHKSLGLPKITLENSWEVFRKMSARIEYLTQNV
ncbi:hypothetical protein B0H11DRAFT_1698749 [Mycena galericulata]|nr:hypothetical protein B0H11DRAFT_1698749 [Mycena galericulata]